VSTLALFAPEAPVGLGGEPTLDDVLIRVWEGLAAQRAVRCPVCAAEMSPVYGAQARPVGGGCPSCGAALR
jgi:hypothetical protein